MKTHRGNFESNLLFLEKTGVLKPGLKILEIGSGLGFLVRHLQSQGLDVTGTEINSQYIREAQEHYQTHLIPMKGDKLDFQDSSFDVVLSFDVFEHIPDTDAHLREVSRVLKPDGYYLFGTPNKITNIPFEILKERSLTKYKEYHCSLHTYNQLRNRLQENGFFVEFVDVPLVNDFFRAKIRKFTGKFGLTLLKLINPDKLPFSFKTNFYIKAMKS